MFSFFITLRGFIFSGRDFSLVFLVVVYLRLTFCGRILSRPLASECFSFTKEQAEQPARITPQPLIELSV